jgi:hypothetical protein
LRIAAPGRGKCRPLRVDLFGQRLTIDKGMDKAEESLEFVRHATIFADELLKPRTRWVTLIQIDQNKEPPKFEFQPLRVLGTQMSLTRLKTIKCALQVPLQVSEAA